MSVVLRSSIFRFLKIEQPPIHIVTEASRWDSGIDAISGYNAQVIPAPFVWRLCFLSYPLTVVLESFLNRIGGLWGTTFIAKFKEKS